MSKNRKALPDFEKALAELEDLVGQLESGELSLDESLEHFKKGVQLTRDCQQVLDQAQQTVEKLLEDGETAVIEAPQADD